MKNIDFSSERCSAVLADITGFDSKRREEYLAWFAKQNEATCVMVIAEQSIKYYVLKAKFKNIYELPIIFFGAILCSISTFAEADMAKDVSKIKGGKAAMIKLSQVRES